MASACGLADDGDHRALQRSRGVAQFVAQRDFDLTARPIEDSYADRIDQWRVEGLVTTPTTRRLVDIRVGMIALAPRLAVEAGVAETQRLVVTAQHDFGHHRASPRAQHSSAADDAARLPSRPRSAG
jgi:hypothetical protein